MRYIVAILALLTVVALQVTSAEEERAVPMVKKNKAMPFLNKTLYVWCDSTHYCFSGEKCCLLSTGVYGCCPHSSDQCCYPNDFCCDTGYYCGFTVCYPWPYSPLSKKNSTTRAPGSAPNSKMVQAPEIVTCPDGSYCLSGETCCPSINRGYDCCPLSRANCCSDDLYCCPYGYRCDLSSLKCYK